MNWKRVIEDNTTPAGRAFDLIIQALIIASLVAFSVDTMPDLTPSLREVLDYFEITCVAIFTLEYIARLAVADGKLRFAFSFYGIVDLVAILPFYLATSVDLRSMRIFRLLRLARAFKLMRYSKAVRRFGAAFVLAKEELVLFLLATVLLLFAASVGIYYFEHDRQPEAFASVFHSLWWAVATLTTVGYGDIMPITTGGKIFTFIVLMIGLGAVAVPAGIISSALTKAVDVDKSTNEASSQAKANDADKSPNEGLSHAKASDVRPTDDGEGG